MYSRLLEELSRAIGARLLIQFSYDNKNIIVEPYLLGKNKNDEDCLCAWEITSVTSDTPPDGHWECFLLRNMKKVKLLDKRFSQKRPGYDPYNSNMSRIYYRF